jgi:hypothetical protein
LDFGPIARRPHSLNLRSPCKPKTVYDWPDDWPHIKLQISIDQDTQPSEKENVPPNQDHSAVLHNSDFVPIVALVPVSIKTAQAQQSATEQDAYAPVNFNGT